MSPVQTLYLENRAKLKLYGIIAVMALKTLIEKRRLCLCYGHQYMFTILMTSSQIR